MHFVCAYSFIWNQAGHQFTVYMETLLQQQGLKFHTKMAWTIPKKKRKGGGAVNVELTGVSKMET